MKRYRHVFYLQGRVAAHLGYVFLCKNNKVFKPFPLENTTFEQNLTQGSRSFLRDYIVRNHMVDATWTWPKFNNTRTQSVATH